MLNGYVKIAIAAFLFSLTPLFVRWIDLDAISLFWCSSLIAAFVLILKMIFQNRKTELIKFNKGLKILIGLGIFTTINNSLFFSAIKITTVANAMLTHYMAPVFVFIFSIVLIKERVTKISILALILAFSGLAIMLSPNEFILTDSHFLGLVLGTSSAIFFSLEILSKKILTKFYGIDVINIRYLLISVILLIPFVSFNEILLLDSFDIISLFVWSIIIIALGITLFISGLKEIKAQHAGVISYIEPLGAVFWGFLIITEIPVIETLVGGAFILLGIYLIMHYRQGG